MTDDPGGSTQNSTRNGIIFFDRLQDEALDEASQQTSGIFNFCKNLILFRLENSKILEYILKNIHLKHENPEKISIGTTRISCEIFSRLSISCDYCSLP